MPQPAAGHNPGQSLLLNVVVAFLAPMFLWSSGGNITFAQLAAIEALDAYRATGPLSLIAAASIIAFELAALSSLSQSMSEDLSLSMALRLRGNANSMDRAAERNRRTLEQDCRIAESPDLPNEAALEAAVADAQLMVQEANARIKAAQQPPAPAPGSAARPAPATETAARAPMPEAQRRGAWAAAMAEVAGELTADIGKLPPKERAAEMMRVEALTQTAAALVSGAPLPAFPPGR
nr:hypothetical protein [uncultured Rhodopila sp.]